MEIEKKYLNNEIIFHQGEKGDCAYLIQSGRVEIFLEKSPTEVSLKYLGEGEVFGEMSLIDGQARSASSRALEPTELIIVTKDQLLDRVKEADPVVRLLMRALLERLRQQNDNIVGKTSTAELLNDPLRVEKKAALERLGLEQKIAGALDQDEFLPYYQPIYSLQNNEMIGCEALIRWISKSGQIISPAIFMDIMEESALIVRAGKMIIEKCLHDLPKILSSLKNPNQFTMAINISGRQFADSSFIEHLEECRNKYSLSTQQIKLEITERVMMEGPQALVTLRKCRELGYKLAIDDFGTGFSSLQYLSQMPLTDLKIDRSFVIRMLEDTQSLSVVKSLVHMAYLLNLRTIAEGIETIEQLDLIRSLGIHMAQGFYFSKAIPVDEFISMKK